jgi:hypothetical protein
VLANHCNWKMVGLLTSLKAFFIEVSTDHSPIEKEAFSLMESIISPSEDSHERHLWWRKFFDEAKDSKTVLEGKQKWIVEIELHWISCIIWRKE